MKKLIIALIAGTTFMGVAQAQTQGTYYLGAGIATADRINNLGGAGNGEYKASGKLFGGYDVTNTWGVEAGYTDFRKSGYNYTIAGVPGHADTDGESFYVAGKMMAPINEQFSVFGKLGVAHNKASLNSTTAGLSRDTSKNELYGGIGAQFHLSKQVALSVEYERYGTKKDFGPKPDVFTVAARYNF